MIEATTSGAVRSKLLFFSRQWLAQQSQVPRESCLYVRPDEAVATGIRPPASHSESDSLYCAPFSVPGAPVRQPVLGQHSVDRRRPLLLFESQPTVCPPHSAFRANLLRKVRQTAPAERESVPRDFLPEPNYR